jgi:hypothetical protein
VINGWDIIALGCATLFLGYKIGRLRESLKWTRWPDYISEIKIRGRWWRVEQISDINDEGVPDR